MSKKISFKLDYRWHTSFTNSIKTCCSFKNVHILRFQNPPQTIFDLYISSDPFGKSITGDPEYLQKSCVTETCLSHVSIETCLKIELATLLFHRISFVKFLSKIIFYVKNLLWISKLGVDTSIGWA